MFRKGESRSILLIVLLCVSFFSITNAKAQPENDDFANAIELTASEGAISGTNIDATGEDNETLPDEGYAIPITSIWYSLSPSDSGTFQIDTIGSDFDTILAVYTGTSVDNLIEVISNDDTVGVQSTVRFEVESGTTYHIAVYGYSGSQGNTTLNWQLIPSVEGKVALPFDRTNSTNIAVSLYAWNFYTGAWVGSQQVTILAGANSADFSFLAQPGDQLRIQYSTNSETDEPYSSYGFYSSAGTTLN